MKLVTVMERPELELLQHGVVVEMYKRMTQSFSIKQKYMEAFNQTERDIIYKHYRNYTRWYFGSGMPYKHAMKLDDYQLMIRAVNFFGTL